MSKPHSSSGSSGTLSSSSSSGSTSTSAPSSSSALSDPSASSSSASSASLLALALSKLTTNSANTNANANTNSHLNNANMTTNATVVDGRSYEIREVWAKNLKQEIDNICLLVDDFPCIAMDTEFPGIVARPVGSFKNSNDYHYQTLKCNVDLLKIIQLGLTFSDLHGNHPDGCATWQFNFRFSLSEDMYAQDSIDLLTSAGIDFKTHDERGIDVADFGELLMTSGIVLNPDVKWISFHSGYDFAYLIKVLSCQPLADDESEFFDLLRVYFPCIYDIKYLMKSCENLKGGLQQLSDDLQVRRFGPQHQAGSDSLLTSAAFFKMRATFFENNLDEEKYMGVLYGLTGSATKPHGGTAGGAGGGGGFVITAPFGSGTTTGSNSTASAFSSGGGLFSSIDKKL